MRISIAMATYNGAAYLRQQLDSLAGQTFLPHELVVTDDGSTDETLAIIERFAEHAPFDVRVYRNPERLNFADNFLRAASLCEGDWIAFCDQDDVWLKDKLELVARAAAYRHASMVVHPVRTVDAALRPIPGITAGCRVRRGNGPERLPPLGFFAGLCITFDAALLPLLAHHPRFPDAHNLRYEASHDKWVSTLADAVGTVKYIRKPLTLYRQHGGNTCGAVRSTLKKSWNLSAAAGAATYQEGAALARQYSDTLARLAAAPEGARWKGRLERASRRYERTHDFLLGRSTLYRARNLFSRLGALGALSAGWSYRFNPIRPPLHAFAKDLCLALVRPSGSGAEAIDAALREPQAARPEQKS